MDKKEDWKEVRTKIHRWKYFKHRFSLVWSLAIHALWTVITGVEVMYELEQTGEE